MLFTFSPDKLSKHPTNHADDFSSPPCYGCTFHTSFCRLQTQTHLPQKLRSISTDQAVTAAICMNLHTLPHFVILQSAETLLPFSAVMFCCCACTKLQNGLTAAASVLLYRRRVALQMKCKEITSKHASGYSADSWID